MWPPIGGYPAPARNASTISHLLREIVPTQPRAAHYGPAQQGGATPSCQDWVSLLPLGR
jgi:hypothetical protein